MSRKTSKRNRSNAQATRTTPDGDRPVPEAQQYTPRNASGKPSQKTPGHSYPDQGERAGRAAHSDQGERTGRAAHSDRAVQLPDVLARWRVEGYGDARDDIRAALSAGADTADDLVALELALRAAIEEPSELDPETRQRALLSTARQLHDRTVLLRELFDYLWTVS